jgi:hypothetical protein
MDLSTGWQTDYLCWDNTEPIAYSHTRRSAGGLAADVEYIPIAKKRQLSTREIAKSNGAYTSLDRVWLVPNVLVQGDPLKPADQIIDQAGSGILYTVLQAEAQRNGVTWRLTCRNPIIAYNLRDVATIETAANLGQQEPAGGQARKQWRTLYANVVCRMQPEDSTVTDQRAMRGILTRYLCYVQQPVTVTNEDRIVFGGNYFDITGIRDMETLDNLVGIQCELRPGG